MANAGWEQSLARRRRSGAAALCLLLALFAPIPSFAGEIPDQSDSPDSEQQFIDGFVNTASAEAQVLWLDADLKAQAADILGHRFSGLRVRYWGESKRTLWILDEIGKEMPITIGVVVDDGEIEDVRILAYRETRGGEVRYPFFTDQFKNLTLEQVSPPRLSGSIDGITGATLSVAAVRKVAILALLFHRNTPFGAP